MKTCNCDLLEEKAVMQAAGGQIEFQGWKAVLVLVVQILLRIVACLVGIPVLVLKLCTVDKLRETSSSETCCDCHCCVVRCLLLEERTTSYINPLFGQDWSSETYCNEQALLAEKMVRRGEFFCCYAAFGTALAAETADRVTGSGEDG